MNPHFCLGFILIIIVVSSVICFNLDGTTPPDPFGSTTLPGHEENDDELAESYEASAEIATPTTHEPTLASKVHVQPPDFNSQLYQNHNNYDHFEKTIDNIFGTSSDNSNHNDNNDDESDENGEELDNFIKSAAFKAKPTTPSPPVPSPQSSKRSPLFRTLTHDIEDLLNLIPIDMIKNISLEFYLHDRHIRSVSNFIESHEFIDIRNRIFGVRELQDFAMHLKSIGINFVELARYVRRKISEANISVVRDRDYAEPGNMGGIDGYLERILEILPQDQLYFMFFEKMEESHEFSEFMKHIGSNDTERYYEKLKNSREFHRELRNLDNHGINMEKLVEFFKTVIGSGNFNAKEDA